MSVEYYHFILFIDSLLYYYYHNDTLYDGSPSPFSYLHYNQCDEECHKSTATILKWLQ